MPYKKTDTRVKKHYSENSESEESFPAAEHIPPNTHSDKFVYYNVLRNTQPPRVSKYSSISRRRGFIISVRFNAEEIEKLDELSNTLNYTTSETIRTAIDILYNMIKNNKESIGNKIIIHNPNIIINNNMNTVTQNVTIDPQILEAENKVLRREKEKLKGIVKFYEEEIDRYRRDIEELQRQLKALQEENKQLSKEAKRLSDLEDTNKRLHAKLRELKSILEEIARTSTQEHVVEKARRALENIYNY